MTTFYGHQLVLSLILCALATALRATPAPAQSKMDISSTAFASGAPIPAKYTCSGEDVSPPLSFSGVAPSARSLVLIVDDPDAPSGRFLHWVVYNLAPTTAHLDQGVSNAAVISNSGSQGRNDFGHEGYGGPCPPPGKPHHYRFRLYALNSRIEPQAATGPGVEQAMEGHIIAGAAVVGTFGR
jgi:Raf kinase inhibitor-like YbhB/YbcL family protein